MAHSPESSKSIRFDTIGPGTGLKPSRSVDSLSSLSSTGAGVNEETTRFLSPERPTSYYATPGANGASGSPYSTTSYNPYDPLARTASTDISNASSTTLHPSSHGHSHTYTNGYANGNGYSRSPIPSLYGESRVSLASMASENSMTQFRKHDALQDSYGAFSISSKGGKKHLAEMVSHLYLN